VSVEEELVVDEGVGIAQVLMVKKLTVKTVQWLDFTWNVNHRIPTFFSSIDGVHRIPSFFSSIDAVHHVECLFSKS